jgi:hypothetical protein
MTEAGVGFWILIRRPLSLQGCPHVHVSKKVEFWHSWEALGGLECKRSLRVVSVLLYLLGCSLFSPTFPCLDLTLSSSLISLKVL